MIFRRSDWHIASEAENVSWWVREMVVERQVAERSAVLSRRSLLVGAGAFAGGATLRTWLSTVPTAAGGSHLPKQGRIRANGLEFGYLEAGEGPLALCLHGFPDSAWTWRVVLLALAGAGYRAIAPWTRGYAPTSIPTDPNYQVGALVQDAIALHKALGGDSQPILVGHDWGAYAAYGAAAFVPQRRRRVVTIAVPPPAVIKLPFIPIIAEAGGDASST
jgi:hypothetical protein